MRRIILASAFIFATFAAHAADDDIFETPSLVSNNVHSLIFRSDWGTGQHLSAFFDVAADRSGILVWAFAVDDNSPIVETEIVHVLPSGTFVSLGKCPTPRCEVNWPRESMTDGQANEILFFMTNTAGARYGASTRISKP